MKKQKTRRDWLMELPEPLNILAVENCIIQNKYGIYDTHCESSSDALTWAFLWSYSEEGYRFWEAVYEELKHLGK